MKLTERTLCPSFHSLVVVTKLEPSSDPNPPLFPPSHHPLGPLVDSASVVTTLHHTNPFSHLPIAPFPLSLCNPFYSLQQHNPFCKDILTTQLLKVSPPPLPYLSSSRPPITQLFPQPSNLNPVLTHDNPSVEDSDPDTDPHSEVTSKVEKRPLPLFPMEGKESLPQKPSNPFLSEPDSEWDNSFDAFAACRLQSTDDLTTESRTLQNAVSDQPLEHNNNKNEPWTIINADEYTNNNDSLHHQPKDTFLFEMSTVPSQAKYSNTYHLDTFQHFLETIPEQRSFESEDLTFETPTNSPKLRPRTENEQDNKTTNSLDTNINPAAFNIFAPPLSSSSPDPSTSGIGSSTEDDGFSYFSSQSDKFSASSSEAESNTLQFEKSAVEKNVKTSEPEESIANKTVDDQLISISKQTIKKNEDHWEKEDLTSSEVSLTPEIPTLRPVATKQESENKIEDTQISNTFNLFPDLLMKPLEPQLKSFVSSQSNSEIREEITVPTVNFIKDFDCFVKDAKDTTIPESPFGDFLSTLPSLDIITSSPSAKFDMLNASFENTVSGEQNVPFNYFSDSHDISYTENRPSQDFDSNSLQAQTTDQSTSNFLQSPFVSADLKNYQTSDSHPHFEDFDISDQNETLNSGNSTICGDFSDIQTTTGVSALEDGRNKSKSFQDETNQTYGFTESPHWAQDKTEHLKTSLPFEDGLQIPHTPQLGWDTSYNAKDLSNGEVENQHGALTEMFSNCELGQDAKLHRSHSEGALTPPLDNTLVPSFGSDPNVAQGSFSTQFDPLFPFPTSFDPPLTPESSSLPVALYPLANISMTMPLSPAHGASPKPALDQTEQQKEAANQQSR